MFDENEKELRAQCPSLYIDIDCTKCGKLVNLPNAFRERYHYLCPQCVKRQEVIESLTFKEIKMKQCMSCPNEVLDGDLFCVSCNQIEEAQKTPEMETLLNNFAKSAFGMSRDEATQKQVCVMCKQDATEFDDALSAKEYKISKMCQKCQDKIFVSEN